ncbi:hypothetical protein SDC9_127414 [bioreactor metagenome]|uniref:CHAD domain-containing protein n=1 Tax=bioreactor metagenome TaxID=1076179 RepID=A0A645CTW5_9ZZZZ
MESIHELRIAMRVLQTLWWFYAPLLDEADAARQRQLFRSMARAAGKVRNLDILIELLDQQEADLHAPAREPSITLSTARAAAIDAGQEVLSAAKLKTQLHRALSRSIKHLGAAAHQQHPLATFADRRIARSREQLVKRAKKALKAPQPNLADFHEVRKSGKKTRYLLEIFGPLLSAKHQKALKRLKKTLQTLGALNDVVATEHLLLENPALLGDSEPSQALLHRLAKQRKRRLRAAVHALRKKKIA